MPAVIGVIMGSTSDWDTMKKACDVLDELEIAYEKKVVSAHRTPDLMFQYAEQARERGLKIIMLVLGARRICQVWLRQRRLCLLLVCQLNQKR